MCFEKRVGHFIWQLVCVLFGLLAYCMAFQCSFVILTSPWSSGKCVRLVTGRFVVRLVAGSSLGRVLPRPSKLVL